MITSGYLCSLLLCRIIIISTCAVLVCAIPEIGIVIFCHVLKDDLASQIRMPHTTAMLMMPLNVEFRPLVELHGTLRGTFDCDIVVVVFILAGWLAVISDLVAGRSVVLWIKQPVGILHIVALFPKLVVWSSWTVQVHVRIGRPNRCEQQGHNYLECHDCHGSDWWRRVLLRIYKRLSRSKWATWAEASENVWNFASKCGNSTDSTINTTYVPHRFGAQRLAMTSMFRLPRSEMIGFNQIKCSSETWIGDMDSLWAVASHMSACFSESYRSTRPQLSTHPTTRDRAAWENTVNSWDKGRIPQHYTFTNRIKGATSAPSKSLSSEMNQAFGDHLYIPKL